MKKYKEFKSWLEEFSRDLNNDKTTDFEEKIAINSVLIELLKLEEKQKRWNHFIK